MYIWRSNIEIGVLNVTGDFMLGVVATLNPPLLKGLRPPHGPPVLLDCNSNPLILVRYCLAVLIRFSAFNQVFLHIVKKNVMTCRQPLPLPKLAEYYFFLQTCAIFWNACKSNYSIFFIFSFKNNLILSFWTWFRNANQWYSINSWLERFNPKTFGVLGQSTREWMWGAKTTTNKRVYVPDPP